MTDRYLQVPKGDGCKLTVGGISRPWVEGECLLFDDFFEHSAENRNSGLAEEEMGVNADETVSSGIRVVLLLDFWKPDLTEDERDVLHYAFQRSK